MKKIISTLIASLVSFNLCAEKSANETAGAYWIQDYITPVVDFPQKGIVFQWWANLLQDPDAFHRAIETFADRYRCSCLDAIVALDSRGFIFGAALAYELKLPLVLIRKSGKLPRTVERVHYGLEYGKSSFEIEVDSLKPNDRVLIIDDVMATGGTAQAAVDLVEKLNAEAVEVACLIEISFLQGRNNVSVPVYSLLATED